MVYILPAFVIGFVFFAFSRLIFKKCKLVVSDVEKTSPDGQRLKGDNLSDFSYDSEDEDGTGMSSDFGGSNLLGIDRTVDLTRTSDEEDSMSASRTLDYGESTRG